MSRREFIKRGLESAVLLYCAVELPISYAAEPRGSLASLPVFLDTLIPADSTPSATQLGLNKALVQHAEKIENYTRLLELGCQWLDETSMKLHGARFDGLSQTRMTAIVTLAEASPDKSIPRLFFERVRFDLMGLYYAMPASWNGLGITSPPQPNGYMDFAQPLKRRGRG
jgi:hypothetical protein